MLLLPEAGVGVFAFTNRTYGGASLPALRAALALWKNGEIEERTIAVGPELAAAYEAARAVWRSGDIAAAPLANNVLMDRDAPTWRKLITDVKANVGTCPADEELSPLSAMEGRFAWSCEHGRVTGRVQRAPTRTMSIQALEFTAAQP